MKDFKYKIQMSAQILPMESDNKEKIISLASKSNNINKLLPKNVDLSQNIGFLLFTGEAFVANTLNANSDGVKTEEAIKLANGFPLTYVDINHKRQHLCGVIIAATYTDYKTGKELTEENIKDSKDPFAVTVTGIVWRAPNPDLADAIENMNASDSPLKDSVYLSWEVAFDETELIVMNVKDSKFTDGEFITNQSDIKKLSNKLISNGGNGFTDDGKKIGRVPIGDVVALGVGLVENPAAAVSPIEVENNTKELKASLIEELKKAIIEEIGKVKQMDECEGHEHKTVNCSCGNTISNCRCSSPTKKVEIIVKGCQDCKNNQKNISQATKPDVITINDNIKINMKLDKIENLTDENLKEIKSSELKELFASTSNTLVKEGIDKISVDFTKKLSEKDIAIKAANENAEKLQTSVKEIEDKLNKVTADYQRILAENQQREAVEMFSARMESIEKDFDLDDKQKEIVANKVKTLTADADFTKYLEEINVLLAVKKKAPKKDKKDDKDSDDDGDDDSKDGKDTDSDKKKKFGAKASTEDDKSVATALKNGQQDDKNVIPNAGAKVESILERAKKAFGTEGWQVVDKRKNRNI